MRIKINNETFDVGICKSLLCKLLGLMFSYCKNDGLLFVFDKETYISLHTIFVFYYIDIIYVDKNLKVIKILRKVNPFIPYIKAVKCKYVIEVKNSKNVRINDSLSFKLK